MILEESHKIASISTAVVFGVSFPAIALAHCPLCTVGAGVAAVAARELGFSSLTVGIFIGGFAAALGYWMARLLLRRKINIPKDLTALVVFLLTVLPLLPLFQENASVYISLAGDYGSLLNRTYVYNPYLAGSIVGGLLVFLAPFASRGVTKLRGGKPFPFQGVTVSIASLLLAAAIVELIL